MQLQIVLILKPCIEIVEFKSTVGIVEFINEGIMEDIKLDDGHVQFNGETVEKEIVVVLSATVFPTNVINAVIKINPNILLFEDSLKVFLGLKI